MLIRSTALSLAILIPATAGAQHCGGPCEQPHLFLALSPNPRYTLSQGLDGSNGRWLTNWYWTEDGEQKHHVEGALVKAPLRDFARRRVFVSPAGNGFLVTGNPYASQRRDDREPPLFVFCDPEGNTLVDLPLRRALAEEERRLDRCPVCKCCTDVLYVFAEDPSLSSNGCFVELRTYNTWRTLGFFLPLGLPVRNREAFEEALEQAEWKNLSMPQAVRHQKEIDDLLRDLGAEDKAVHLRAAEALVAKGFLARRAIRTAQSESKSANLQARATAVEQRLRPLAGAEWEALAIDLGLLSTLLTYPDEDVARTVRATLDRILPASKGMDAAACSEWIREHRPKMKWNAAKGQYEE